jgi:hypothetical protein
MFLHEFVRFLNQALVVDGKNPSFSCPEAPNLFVNL